jgi:hypothetical protein
MVKRVAGSLARRRSLYAPIRVCFFSADAEMPAPEHIAHMIEQLARPRWHGKLLFFFRESTHFG